MQEKTAALAAQILHTFASPDDRASFLGGSRYQRALLRCRSRQTACAGVAGSDAVPGSNARRCCGRAPISRRLIATYGEESAVGVRPTRSPREAIASVMVCTAPRKARAVDTARSLGQCATGTLRAAQPQVETGNARTQTARGSGRALTRLQRATSIHPAKDLAVVCRLVPLADVDTRPEPLPMHAVHARMRLAQRLGRESSGCARTSRTRCRSPGVA